MMNQITDESIKAGPKAFEEESGVFLKTVNRAVMNKLGDQLQKLSTKRHWLAGSLQTEKQTGTYGRWNNMQKDQ